MKTQTLIFWFLGCVIALLFASDGFCQAGQKDFPLLKGSYLGQKPPGAIPKIFAPGIVSTDWYNHCTISISPDGSEIYWAMAPLDMPGRIYFSKIVNGVWTKPEIVSFTQSEDGDCPVLSPDGVKMYFNSNRPLPQNNGQRERIWCVERTQEGWGNPFPLGPEINDQHLHWQISVDARGNLFFGSERSGTKGRDDVFMAGNTDGVFQKPLSLGTAINSSSLEGCPFIAPDGSYLIFCRDGLWISFKGKNGSWTKAISMGDRFKEAICPYISPDGKYLFYLGMGMGYNDIYWVETRSIESLHPKETNLKLEKIY